MAVTPCSDVEVMKRHGTGWDHTLTASAGNLPPFALKPALGHDAAPQQIAGPALPVLDSGPARVQVGDDLGSGERYRGSQLPSASVAMAAEHTYSDILALLINSTEARLETARRATVWASGATVEDQQLRVAFFYY